MAAEVKLVLDNKIATDKSKGETTSTTRTQCVSLLPLLSPVEGGPRALNHSANSTRSVFEKTYAYVKRMSFPNATVETAHSIRQCVHTLRRGGGPALCDASCFFRIRSQWWSHCRVSLCSQGAGWSGLERVRGCSGCELGAQLCRRGQGLGAQLRCAIIPRGESAVVLLFAFDIVISGFFPCTEGTG